MVRVTSGRVAEEEEEAEEETAEGGSATGEGSWLVRSASATRCGVVLDVFALTFFAFFSSFSFLFRARSRSMDCVSRSAASVTSDGARLMRERGEGGRGAVLM